MRSNHVERQIEQMDEKVVPTPMNCVCGASARIRYRIPVVWIECRKKCGMRTRYYPDVNSVRDPESEDKAILEWNRMVSNNGR